MLALSKRLFAATSIGLAVVLGAVGAQAAPKDRLAIDLVNEPSSLDPHVQWNPDSYYVYRNVFDNLVTRDDAGKIIPQIATAWKYLSDTQIEFQLRDDVKFHDGSKLTAEDVAYSAQRITDPKFASPQLSQFDQIVKADITGPNTMTLTTKSAYPALLAQLVKLSIATMVETDFYLTLDADVVCVKPLRFDALIRDGRAVTNTTSEDWHSDWYGWCERVLGMRRSGITHGGRRRSLVQSPLSITVLRNVRFLRMKRIYGLPRLSKKASMKR